MRIETSRRWTVAVLAFGLIAVVATPERSEAATRPTETARDAGVGAAGGGATALIVGQRQADQILVGAAIGAAAGAGVGAYMDAQEEKLARISGTTVERIEKDTLLVRFDSDILFDTDSATIGPAARGTLEEVAGVLAEYANTAVVVQGHTDSVGPPVHNQQLSEKRAESVGRALVENGVGSNRVASSGHGESLPVASNSSDRGRQLNRRVTLLLKAKTK